MKRKLNISFITFTNMVQVFFFFFSTAHTELKRNITFHLHTKVTTCISDDTLSLLATSYLGHVRIHTTAKHRVPIAVKRAVLHKDFQFLFFYELGDGYSEVGKCIPLVRSYVLAYLRTAFQERKNKKFSKERKKRNAPSEILVFLRSERYATIDKMSEICIYFFERSYDVLLPKFLFTYLFIFELRNSSFHAHSSVFEERSFFSFFFAYFSSFFFEERITFF